MKAPTVFTGSVWFSVMWLLLCLGVSSMCLGGSGPEDVGLAEGVLRDWARAWESGNVDKIMTGYVCSEDTRFYSVERKMFSGYRMIRKAWVEDLEKWSTQKVELKELKVREGGSIAWATGRVVSLEVLKEDGSKWRFQSQMTFILRREGRSWKIQFLQNSKIPGVQRGELLSGSEVQSDEPERPEEVVQKWRESLKDSNIDNLLGLYAPHAFSFSFPKGDARNGIEELRTHFWMLFREVSFEKVDFDKLRVQRGDKTAWVTCRISFTCRNKKGRSGEKSSKEFQAIFVLEQISNRWLIAHTHFTLITNSSDE